MTLAEFNGAIAALGILREYLLVQKPAGRFARARTSDILAESLNDVEKEHLRQVMEQADHCRGLATESKEYEEISKGLLISVDELLTKPFRARNESGLMCVEEALGLLHKKDKKEVIREIIDKSILD